MSIRKFHHEKKEEHIKKIRKEARQNQIKTLRYKMIIQYEFSEPIMEELSNQAIFNNIKLRINLKGTLQTLTQQILSPNYNAQKQIWHFFDSGMLIPIMDNLTKNICLKETFELVSSILSKLNIKVAHKFVNFGLIQQLVKWYNEPELVQILSNIFLNIAIESQDYVQIFLLNNIHKTLMNQFQVIISCDRYQTDPVYFRKTLTFIMGALTNLVNCETGNLDFENSFGQILTFSCNLLKNNIMPKDSIVIIYQITAQNLVPLGSQIVTPYLNTQIAEINGDAEHLNYLLILINRLTPIQINYESIFRLMFITKEYKICLRIIEKLTNDQKSLAQLQTLKKNQLWWEKTFSIIDQSLFQTMLKILNGINIQYQCVYRFLYECMSSTFNSQLIVHTFLILRNKILKEEPVQKKIKLWQNLQKFGIQQRLLLLALKQNYVLSQKAGDLIYMIKQMKKQNAN